MWPVGSPGPFGSAVCVDGDLAIVGARGDDENGVDSGAAYIYQKSDTGWTEMAKLTAPDAAPGDLFGWSVGIWGERAIVGSAR